MARRRQRFSAAITATPVAISVPTPEQVAPLGPSAPTSFRPDALLPTGLIFQDRFGGSVIDSVNVQLILGNASNNGGVAAGM